MPTCEKCGSMNMKPGTKIIQINPGRTYFDSEADLNIRAEADPIFKELMGLFSKT